MATPVFDRSALMESLGEDEELYKEIVQLFLEHHGNEIENLKRELAAQSAPNLQRVGHSIKGSVSNFAAERATNAARELEQTMKQGWAPNTAQLVDEVIAAVSELAEALKADIA